MPGKKKKYNARFPPARIKKIMQSDEEVGKVAAAVPVIISRALELFVQSLLTKAGEITAVRHARTLTPSHLKQCVIAERRFDFLQELFTSVSSIGGECESEFEPITPLQIAVPEVISLPCNNPSVAEPINISNSDREKPSRGRGKGRGRGRPKKVDSNNTLSTGIKRPRGRPRKCAFVDSVVDDESNDRLEVDLEATSSDDNTSEGDATGQEIEKMSVTESSEKVTTSDLSKQTSTKFLPDNLLGGIQITIPEVATNSFFNNNGASSAPVVMNGTGGIPVPVITSMFEFSKRTTTTTTFVPNQIDEDYDC